MDLLYNKQRIILVLILVILLLYSYTGELVAYNEGKGWDGDMYCDIIQNFDTLILTKGIDAYHMTRFLPFALIHYILIILNIPITTETAILSSKIFNFISIAILILYFFKLSKLMSWDWKCEIIAFSFTFYNSYVLKFFGYNPITCDCFGLLLSYLAVYFFFANKRFCGFVVGAIALMSWPILSILVFILFLFPRNSVEMVCNSDKNNETIYKTIRLFFITFVPVAGLICCSYLKFRHPDWNFFHFYFEISVYKGMQDSIIVSLSLLAVSLFYFYATKSLKVDYMGMLKAIMTTPILIRVLVAGTLFIICYKILISLGKEAVFSPMGQFLIMLRHPATDIFIFLESPFIYLGLFFILILLCWKEIVAQVCNKYGISYYIILLIALLFILETETRKLTSFYPIMLVPLIECLKRMRLKRSVVYAIPIVCIISSFFWFSINTINIEEAFNCSYDTYWRFPAQRYYMFFGPWQNHNVYLVTILIEVFFIFSIVFLYRKGILTEKTSTPNAELH